MWKPYRRDAKEILILYGHKHFADSLTELQPVYSANEEQATDEMKVIVGASSSSKIPKQRKAGHSQTQVVMNVEMVEEVPQIPHQQLIPHPIWQINPTLR